MIVFGNTTTNILNDDGNSNPPFIQNKVDLTMVVIH